MEVEVIAVDGIDVEVVKPGRQLIERLIDRHERQVQDAQRKITEAAEHEAEQTDRHIRDVQLRDAKIQALNHEVENAHPTPEQIAQLVSVHQRVRNAAVVIMGRDDALLQGQTLEEMHRTVVAFKMGDVVAKAMDAEQLEAAFEAIRAVAGKNASSQAAVQQSIPEAIRDTDDQRVHAQTQQSYEEQIAGRREKVYDALRKAPVRVNRR